MILATLTARGAFSQFHRLCLTCSPGGSRPSSAMRATVCSMLCWLCVATITSALPSATRSSSVSTHLRTQREGDKGRNWV